MKKKFDIFISYRRDGGFETANLIHDRLTRAGYNVFMDIENLRSGKFNEQLYTQIDNCKEILVILGPNSLERCINEDDWLRLEVAYAIKNNKNIIPIFLRNFKYPDTPLPSDIAELHNYEGIEASHELFNAFLERLKKLLISKRYITWDRIKRQVLFSMIPLIVVAGTSLFIYYEYKRSEEKKLEQICKEVVSFISTGFANGNELISTIDEVNKEWKNLHINLLKTKDPSEKARLKEQLNQLIDFKLKQINDTSVINNWHLNPAYEELLAKNGISTEDIKGSKIMFRSDIKQTEDYLLHVKYWIKAPEMGWPSQLDEAIDKLAQMNIESINSGIYSFNELIIEMPVSVRDTYNKIITLLTNYSAEMDYRSTHEELEAKQNRSMQKCNALLEDYSATVGNENMKVALMKNQLDSLKVNKKKVRTFALNNPKIDSLKQNIAKKKEVLEQKKIELGDKKLKLRQSYSKILQKCSFDQHEDEWMMWGKILHLAQFGYAQILNEKNYKVEYEKNKIEARKNRQKSNAVKPLELTISVKEVFQEVQNRLDQFLAYNRAKDSNAATYIPAAKRYYKLISENKLEPLGILMVGTDNNVPHPFLKTGDIIVERKGNEIDRVDTYAKLKENPAKNVVKVIRFTSDGKKTTLTDTISPNCKVLVGMMNLWEEKQ